MLGINVIRWKCPNCRKDTFFRTENFILKLTCLVCEQVYEREAIPELKGFRKREQLTEELLKFNEKYIALEEQVNKRKSQLHQEIQLIKEALND